MVIRVWGEPGAVLDVKGRRAALEESLAAGAGWAEIQIPWQDVPSGESDLSVVVEANGRQRVLTRRVSRPPLPLRLWRPAERPSRVPAPALPAVAALQDASGSSYEKATPIPAGLDGDSVVFDVELCHVRRATAPEGAVATRKDGLLYRIPVATLRLRARAGLPLEAASLLLDVTSGNGQAGRLTISLEPASLVEVLFSRGRRALRSDAPVYRRGGPLLLLRSGDPPRLLHAAEAALADVAAVVEETRRSVDVEACTYRLSWPGPTKSIRRIREEVTLTAYEVRSGLTLATRTFRGDRPPECPPDLMSDAPPLWGPPPSRDPIDAWLSEL